MAHANHSSHDHHGHDSHGHHHGHDHDHHDHGRNAPAHVLTFALLLTLGFAAVEAIAGWWSGSLALLGDAGHMVTDSMALAIAAAAARLSRLPATDTHTYGLRRIETLAGLLNGLTMLLVVGVIVWHAIERLIAPQPVEAGVVMVVAAIGLVINIVVAWVLSRGESNLNTRAAMLHVLGDLLGSVAALAAGVIIHFTGWTAVDPLLSVLICGLILAATVRLLRHATHTLLDAVPPRLSLTEVGNAMAAADGVASVHDLHIWSLDSSEAALSAHVVLLRGDDWPRVLPALQALLRERFDIEHATLQPELPPRQVIRFTPSPRARNE